MQPRFFAHRRARLFAAAASLCLASVASIALPASAHGGGGGSKPSKTHSGDVLHIFDNARLYIVTAGGDPSLADTLLAGCHPKERRVLTLKEWAAMSHDVREYVSTVFLIDREHLPTDETIPDDCPAAKDTVYTSVVRSGHPGGLTYAVTVSAPDSPSLHTALDRFRRFAEPPRHPIEEIAPPSLTLVPLGARADFAANDFVKARSGDGEHAPHVLPAAYWSTATAAGRLTSQDEVLLIDRSRPAALSAFIRKIDSSVAHQSVGSGDSVVWREQKPDGHARIFYTAPNADLLAESLRRLPDPLKAPETPEVLLTAHDLRAVRRIAVAGVRSGAGGADLARRLASRVATDLRRLNAFEVLERAGLSEVLGEVALGQAGITKANDRARVRQMAAADALLEVEVIDSTGGTEYAAKHERETPPIAAAPRRPLPPSRAKYALSVPSKDGDASFQQAIDAVVSQTLGTKTEEQYHHDLHEYNEKTLPAWQRSMDDYERDKATRAIKWRETIVATDTVTVSGSLRLVDLTDGLVLWEQPFTTTRHAERTWAARTVYTQGEDSAPNPSRVPLAETVPPADLLAVAAEAAVAEGIDRMPGTAILPSTQPETTPSDDNPIVAAPPAAAPVQGRILDIDGDSLLIGLGASDGLKPGDTLILSLGDGRTIAVTTTRIRPRTCDGTCVDTVPAALRARIAVGMTVAIGGGDAK